MDSYSRNIAKLWGPHQPVSEAGLADGLEGCRMSVIGTHCRMLEHVPLKG